MKKAAEIAQANEFINANEKGFERTISQGGRMSLADKSNDYQSPEH